ncbi:hypothetical protein [Deinococcus aestuarii]|uniref:hypothetical protein n=1 Tax=Deinococcus aestuarii TaxID=2774531 RepID=UPI001C0B5479|nr:hypothetical protein [Deinococcus aestuarii]
MRKEDSPGTNLKLGPAIPVSVRRLSAERPQPEIRELAQVMEDGYRQRVVGRAGDLPATLAWLAEREADPSRRSG